MLNPGYIGSWTQMFSMEITMKVNGISRFGHGVQVMGKRETIFGSIESSREAPLGRIISVYTENGQTYIKYETEWR